MSIPKKFDAALTTLGSPSPFPEARNVSERQQYCNETLQELSLLANSKNYHLPYRPQALTFLKNEYEFSGYINFALNGHLTWIDLHYIPVELDQLACEIFFSDPVIWDVQTRGSPTGVVEVPKFRSDGWADVELSAAENATKIVETVEKIADAVDTIADYSDFICNAENVPLFRIAQASSLILEGKREQSRDLAEKLCSGDLKQAGIEWYSYTHGKPLPVGELILRWLEKVQNA